MKVKSINISDEKHTHTHPHIHGQSDRTYTPVQDIVFEMEDGRKYLAKMTFVLIDAGDKNTT